MKHLIISRELPPATYPAGGIGTYVANIAQLLAESGETVHVIGERWRGAPLAREVLCDGRLVVHRIAPEDVPSPDAQGAERLTRELQGLRKTAFPAQWFAWSAAFLVERLIEEEGVELIEAQEWEAPLYFYLLRRSLGLGPQRRPPCIVHLHSPSIYIHRFNGSAVRPPNLAPLARMEEFCIRSADALLCPSRRMAGEVTRDFRLPADAVEVIPLPVGLTAPVERSQSVWSDGSICYVGRLEPRKGVIEWVEAAIRIANEDASVHFDFVGADIWNLRNALVAQIGPKLRPRFRFHGAKSKDEIIQFLAKAKAAVVPSRWENFPNVCIEAMASGVPVISTRYGGMSDMIEDGRTGWLAEDSGVAGMVDSLADALRRCLATSPLEKAAMGAAAAQAIRLRCDNDSVVTAHKRFRAQVAAKGAALGPADPPALGANVVVRAESLDAARPVLRSLEAQTMAPDTVAVVYRKPDPEPGDTIRLGEQTELVLEHAPDGSGPQLWNAGHAAAAARRTAGFWLFLDEHDRLEPDCLALMAKVFARRPTVGVVSPWTDRTASGGGLDAHPSPSSQFQMIGNDVAPASGFRAEALDGTRPFKSGLPRELDIWAVANEVMARGWEAVTLPGMLARREAPAAASNWMKATAERAIRAEALAAFDDERYRLALQLVDAYVPLAQASQDARDIRLFILRAASAILYRPRHVARKCLRLVAGPFARGATKP